MHIITWTNKTDAWGHIYDEKDSKRWYQQSWMGMEFKEALFRLKSLQHLERKGVITNIKHVFED